MQPAQQAGLHFASHNCITKLSFKRFVELCIAHSLARDYDNILWIYQPYAVQMHGEVHSSRWLLHKGLHHTFATFVHYMYGGTCNVGKQIDITPELYAAVSARNHWFTTWYSITTAGGGSRYIVFPASTWLCFPCRLEFSFMKSSCADKDCWIGISFSLLLDYANCPLCGQ